MLKLKVFSADQLVQSGCSTGWLLRPECVRVNYVGCVFVTLTRQGNSFAFVRLCGAGRFRHRRRRTPSAKFSFLLRLWTHCVLRFHHEEWNTVERRPAVEEAPSQEVERKKRTRHELRKSDTSAATG